MRLEAYYSTRLGRAYLGDGIDVMSGLSAESVDLVVTSPPFPLTFRKSKPYISIGEDRFVDWFLPYAEHCRRVLKPDGSLVIDLGGVWNKGVPTKSLYQHRLLLALCDQAHFHLAQDFYWYNPAALPSPAEWVNVRRIRVKSAVDLVCWLGKSETPRANNKEVLKEYSRDMLRLIKRGYRAKERPSGHCITNKFQKNLGGSIPPNLIQAGNNDSNSGYLKGCAQAGLPVHPARFPRALPEFFIKLCTRPGEMVLDPFGGSNVTGEAAEHLGRRWISIELVEDYLKGSRFGFASLSKALPLLEASLKPRRQA